MSSVSNSSARIASPPGKTGARSGVTSGSRICDRRCRPRSASAISRSMPVLRDRGRSRIEMPDQLADDANGAGAADGVFPALASGRRPGSARAPGARRRARAAKALVRHLAVAESARRLMLTQPMCRLSSFSGIEPLADDQLGAAAADVDDQPLAGLVRHRVRDADVDQARLLDAGDDLDGMAERLARTLEERLLAMRLAQRVGADDAHAVSRSCRAAAGRSVRRHCERARRRRPCRAVPARPGPRRGGPFRAGGRG